jgi:7-cyano-7-deazaguanine synthase
MENAINKGTSMAVNENRPFEIHAPFLNKNKSEEIKLGMKLGVDYSNTWSCYRGKDIACGTCDSCVLRKKAFFDAGFVDPVTYKV